MKRLFTIVYLVLITLQVYTQKRGLGYGYHSASDLEVLSPNVGWWYNWYVKPEAAVASVYQDYGFEFVPMTWNGSFNESLLRSWLDDHPDVKYLLAFNEPNFKEQANMTPGQVAAQWPRLESIAEDYNLEIVGPAVNYCGNCVTENGVTYYDPFEYLDDFFEVCPDCRVDYIAVHCYMNTPSALKWYIGEFKKYGKPIWLTEFAGWESNGNIQNLQDQVEYMVEVLDYLENDPDVFRYAWFVGRTSSGINSYPYIDILGSTRGTLTPLGEVYIHMPVHDESRVIEIPALIQAEEYNTMSGVRIQLTEDDGGFANVAYIDAGDWMEYRISVPETMEYDIHFRFAAIYSTSLDVLVDDEVILTQDFSYTGGWQKWNSVSSKINLIAGEHVMKLVAKKNGFNLNWILFGDPPVSNKEFGIPEMNIYPNPCEGIFNIDSDREFKLVEIYTITGRKVASFQNSLTLDLGHLNHGMYILIARDTDLMVISKGKLVIR